MDTGDTHQTQLVGFSLVARAQLLSSLISDKFVLFPYPSASESARQRFARAVDGESGGWHGARENGEKKEMEREQRRTRNAIGEEEPRESVGAR